MTDIRSGNCPLCGHDEILEQSSEPTGQVTEYIAQDPPFLPPRQETRSYGAVLTYVCLGCGYCQRFVKDPQLLPRDGGRILRGTKPSPYR